MVTLDFPEPVVLATLIFDALGAGEGGLGLSGNIAPSGGFLGGVTGGPLPVLLAVTSVVVNGAPVADAQSVTTDEDVPTAITLTGSDINGDALNFTLTSQPAIGGLGGTPPNLTYTPDLNLNGSDSFTFIADDGLLASPPATVDITITPINDPPNAGADAYDVNEDGVLEVAAPSVMSDDMDVDGDPLTVSLITGPDYGTVMPRREPPKQEPPGT